LPVTIAVYMCIHWRQK